MYKALFRKFLWLLTMIILLLTACVQQGIDTETQQATRPLPTVAAPTAAEAAATPDTEGTPAPERDIEGTKRVWMSVFHPSDLIDLSQWEYVSANLDTVSVFIDYLLETDSDVTADFADMLRRTGIKLSVECAGIADWLADSYVPGTDMLGKMSAECEIERLSRLKRAGKDVDYVVFDHPVTRAMYPNEDYSQPARMTFAQAAEQLAYAMKTWKEAYPDIKFIYCVNFPNHGWKGGPAYYSLVDEYGRGDFFEELQAVAEATQKEGVEFYGLVADNPYDYATGTRPSPEEDTVRNTDWMARLLDLEKEVNNLGWEFALYFNSETPGTSGPEGEYYRQTISYINDYTASGGQPDIYLMESWYQYPLEYVPESEPYSMTYLVADVIRQVNFGETADLSSIDMASETPAPPVAETVNSWQFDERVEGWIDYSDIGDMYSADGVLCIECSGTDPYILSPSDNRFDADSYSTLHLRIKNTTVSSSLTVFFATDAESSFDERKSVTVPMTPAAAGYEDLIIDLSSNALWRGTILRLRIDPGSSPGIVYIDSISLEP